MMDDQMDEMRELMEVLGSEIVQRDAGRMGIVLGGSRMEVAAS